jgi:hypothetical protein
MKQFLSFLRGVNVFAKVTAYLLTNPRHFIKKTQVAYVWNTNQLSDAAETMHMLDDKRNDLLI